MQGREKAVHRLPRDKDAPQRVWDRAKQGLQEDLQPEEWRLLISGVMSVYVAK